MGRVSDARERLIAATIELIWLESYGAVTVDAICERANVKKGSFYHFFSSKDELVIESLEAHWQLRRAVLDTLFSPTVEPLDRLRTYFEHVYQRQLELKAKHGRFLGCFYSSVGVECAKQNPEIRLKVQEIMTRYMRYYESSLRDAQAAGLLPFGSVTAKANGVFAYMEGVLGQARIQNDPELLKDLGNAALRMIGAVEPVRKAG